MLILYQWLHSLCLNKTCLRPKNTRQDNGIVVGPFSTAKSQKKRVKMRKMWAEQTVKNTLVYSVRAETEGPVLLLCLTWAERNTLCDWRLSLSLMQHWFGNKYAYIHAHVLFDSAEKACCPCLLRMSEGLHPKFCVEARSWSRWSFQVWEWLPGWGKERPWDAGCLETYREKMLPSIVRRLKVPRAHHLVAM